MESLKLNLKKILQSDSWKKKTKKILIIMLVISMIFVSAVTNNLNNEIIDAIKLINSKVGATHFLKNEVISILLLCVSSFVPYLYIGYVAMILLPVMFVIRLVTFPQITFFKVIAMGIHIFAFSQAILFVNIYCKKNTLNYRIKMAEGYTFTDIKKILFNMSKNGEEKVKKLDKEHKEKIEKLKKERNNIQVDYKVIMCMVLFTSILVLVATLIEKI